MDPLYVAGNGVENGSRPLLSRRRSRVNNIRRDRDDRFPPEPSFLRLLFLPHPQPRAQLPTAFPVFLLRPPVSLLSFNSTPLPFKLYPIEQLGDELVRASTGWNVIIFVRFLATTTAAAALPLLALGRERGNEIVFYFGEWDLHTDYLCLSPKRLFQTIIFLF